MAYKTVFNTKPKKENKQEFCNRIVELLNSISYKENGYSYRDGRQMLESMFRYCPLNKGYSSIKDLLYEANINYCDIFKLRDSYEISDEEIFVNIDIIVNCFYSFKKNAHRHFTNENDAFEIIELMFKAINIYLLSYGYKLVFNEEERKVLIVETEIAIDINDINDEKLKNEVINFYNYKNANDIEEKKKIMLILIGDLESRKNKIEKILGSRIADMFTNYVNNFNLRHNNISEEYKKYYNKPIASLNDEELIKWYDYIFAFMINIYMSLDKLKDVNINNGYE